MTKNNNNAFLNVITLGLYSIIFWYLNCSVPQRIIRKANLLEEADARMIKKLLTKSNKKYKRNLKSYYFSCLSRQIKKYIRKNDLLNEKVRKQIERNIEKLQNKDKKSIVKYYESLLCLLIERFIDDNLTGVLCKKKHNKIKQSINLLPEPSKQQFLEYYLEKASEQAIGFIVNNKHRLFEPTIQKQLKEYKRCLSGKYLQKIDNAYNKNLKKCKTKHPLEGLRYYGVSEQIPSKKTHKDQEAISTLDKEASSFKDKTSSDSIKKQLDEPSSKLIENKLISKKSTDIKTCKLVQIEAINAETISEAAKKIVGISDVDFSDDNTELGKRVHAELAEYYKDGSRMSYDDLKEKVSRQIARHLSRKAGMQTEFSVSLDGVKGRCDLVIIRNNICQYLADFKTGKNINGKYLEYCEEQLRLYLRALKNNDYNVESTIVEIVCPDGIIPVNIVKDSAISSTIVEIECPDGIIPINIVKDSAISSTSAQGMGKWNQNEPFPWDEYFKNIEKQRQTSKK